MALFFIGLLVIAFGFWGIGDIFRAKPKNTIATVGDLDITKDLLSIEFQRKMGSYRGQLNQTFDERMLRGAILNEILREYALIYKIKNLKITTPKEYVAKKIASTKQFKDSENNFNKDIFLKTLRANGYTEKSFTEKIKIISILVKFLCLIEIGQKTHFWKDLEHFSENAMNFWIFQVLITSKK